MKWIALILLTGLSLVCRGQDFEKAYVALLEKELRVLPYRDLTARYSLRYDDLERNYVFSAPDLCLDTLFVIKLTQQINALPQRKAISYQGTIRFDNYTDAVIVWSHLFNEDSVFVTKEVSPEPPGGMRRFVQRWTNFVDSLKACNEFDVLSIDEAASVKMLVERDGSLHVRDSSALGLLLRRFLKQEKHWLPGIAMGQPLLSLFEMRLPDESPDSVCRLLRSGLSLLRSLGGEEQLLCYAHFLPISSGEILSLVYGGPNRRSMFPVFHRGKPAELAQVLKLIETGGLWMSCIDEPCRVYFYTERI